MNMKIFGSFVVAALTLTQAHAQSTTSPAQMGMAPNGALQTLQTLDNTKTWVPIGSVNPATHTFSAIGGGPQTMTQLLSGSGAPTWTASYTAGGTCPQSIPPAAGGSGSVFCGGTEGRQFAVKNAYQLVNPTQPAQLYFGNSYWMDTPGAEGPQNAQIFVLNGPEREGNPWTQDVNLGATGLPNYVTASATASYCPTDNPVCTQAVSALQKILWQWDSHQNSVNVETVVASSWWKGSSSISGLGLCPGQTPIYVWVKNNTPSDFYWYQTLLACETNVAGQGTPQIRSFGVHTDQVTLAASAPVQQIFAGEAPSGVFVGQLSNSRGAGTNPIVWNTGLTSLEWHSSNYSGPTCTAQNRVMGFAEATGSDGKLRLYLSVCFQIWMRVDGNKASCAADQVFIASVCQQRWQLYWTNPNGAAVSSGPGSMSGMRGLTTIPGENILWTGAEGGSPMSFFAVKPYPACSTPTDPTCSTVEYNVFASTAAATGMSTGNTVAPYNNLVTVNDELGNPHYIAPQSSYITAASPNMIPPFTFMYLSAGASGKKLAEAIYTYRTSAGRYNFAYIPQLFATPMNGIRDMVMSPFQDDCGYYGSNILTCAVYAAGGDMDGAGGFYWCKQNPCPSTPTFVPSHNLGWVARGGFQNP